jgi:hypothetical protein
VPTALHGEHYDALLCAEALGVIGA